MSLYDKLLNQHLGTKLHWSIVIFKQIQTLLIISSSVVWAKLFGVSLFNIIFVLKEKGGITLLLTVYEKYTDRVLNIHGFHMFILKQMIFL